MATAFNHIAYSLEWSSLSRLRRSMFQDIRICSGLRDYRRSHLRPRFCHRLFQPFSLLASNFHRLLLHGRFRYRLIACPFLHPRVVLYLRLPRAMSRELNRHHVFELGAIALAVIHLGGYPPEFTNIFPTPIPVTLKPHKARKGGRAQLV